MPGPPRRIYRRGRHVPQESACPLVLLGAGSERSEGSKRPERTQRSGGLARAEETTLPWRGGARLVLMSPMRVVQAGGGIGDDRGLLALVLDFELDGHMRDAQPSHLHPNPLQHFGV
jgi:hypothetical protein